MYINLNTTIFRSQKTLRFFSQLLNKFNYLFIYKHAISNIHMFQAKEKIFIYYCKFYIYIYTHVYISNNDYNKNISEKINKYLIIFKYNIFCF